MGMEARFLFKRDNYLKEKAKVIEFDDMETFEHTKCKPLSISLAVESKTRRILGVEVRRMPAKGPLSRGKRYGPRPDERRGGRKSLFTQIKELAIEEVRIKSDSNPHYSKDIEEFFPLGSHIQYKGKRGASTGQGELKKVRFDPLFSLNHTCAKIRADVNRLFRRTWCTTKKPDRLQSHLILYAHYHNQQLA
ncbi:MAG TPA: hypothetical protein VIH99_02195 [Bdellovibrionota bacterium]